MTELQRELAGGPETIKHLQRLLLSSGDLKGSQCLLFLKDLVPWKDTDHKSHVNMSLESQVPCSLCILSFRGHSGPQGWLHCGFLLEVSIGPDTWECFQLHVMSNGTAEPPN